MSRQLYVIILLFMSFMTSCRKDTVKHTGAFPWQNADLVRVGFQLSLPGSQQPLKTYTTTETDENTIQHILLLAFKVADEKETLAYYQEGMQIYEGVSAEIKTFWANLPKSTDNYHFVLLVNGGEQISNIVAGISKGTEKSLVMKQLTYAITNKWDASPGSFTPIPMWGESNIVIGINAQTNSLPSIKLLRSLVRVDINLKNDALDNFSITSVHLLNANDMAFMAPSASNYDALNNAVTSPSIPEAATMLPMQDYILPNPLKSIERQIYLFEARTANTGAVNATALVIGGRYNDSNTNTYYRIDFVDGSGNPIALLRNHNYIINITKVSAPGLPDPEDAFKAKGINMNVSVAPWSEESSDYMAIGGEFVLSVQSQAALGSGEETNVPILINTDYPGGWTATLTINPDNFVTITHANSGVGFHQLILQHTANNTGTIRNAVITVKAGNNLTKTITLTQSY